MDLNDSSETKYTPHISCNGNNIWVTYRVGARLAVLNSSDRGGTWTYREPRIENVAGDAGIEAIGTKVYIVYTKYNSGTNKDDVVFFNSSDSGNTFGNDVTLWESYYMEKPVYAWTTYDFRGLSVNGTGSSSDKIYALAHYTADTGSEGLLFKNSSDAGSTWSSTITIGSGADDLALPSIASFGDDVYITGEYDSPKNINISNSSVYSSWTKTKLDYDFDNTYYNHSRYASVAMNGSNPVVFWSQMQNATTGTDWNVVYRSYDNGWGDTVFITTDGNNNLYVNAKKDYVGNCIEFVYRNGTSSPYDIIYDKIGVCTPLPDTTPPAYSLNSTNSTLAGTPVEHRLKWLDNVGLSGYIFSFDNCTGTLTNDTWTAFSSNPDWSNVTKTINSTVGCTIRWCVYVNDTSNNWNGTSCENPFSYVTIKPYLEVTLIYPPTDSSNKVLQNSTFNVNATVTCRNADCGNVYGTVRYNVSSANPDTPINTTKGDIPFHTVGDFETHPYTYESWGSDVLPDNPEYAYDDGFNDTSTYAQLSAASSRFGIDEESVVYDWDLQGASGYATLFYTWEISSACTEGLSGAGSRIYFYNWKTDNWDEIYVKGDDQPLGTFNLDVNSNYINSTGGIKVKFKVYAIGAGATATALMKLYDTYVYSSTNPQFCGNLNENDTCQLMWTVNATGEENSTWKIDVNFASNSTLLATPKHTQSAIIRIVVPNIIIHGNALYYYTGEKVNGEITFIPLESSYSLTSPVYDGIWTLYVHTDLSNVSYFTLVVDDNEKKGYSEVKIANPTVSTPSCSPKSIQLSGYSIDANDGTPVSSGTVKATILETGYTTFSTFSRSWGIALTPCLVSGKVYTIQITITDDSGQKIGKFFQKYPAR